MALSDEELGHLEKLARVKLGPEARERLRAQLERIIDFVRVLQKADTSDASTDRCIVNVTSYMRDDTAGPCLPRDRVLEEAPQHEGGFFRVPPAIES